MSKEKTTMSKELTEWLESTPTYNEVLKDIDKLEPLDFENDPKFVADFMKGQITEDILLAMEEEGINKSQLAERMGKSRQYIGRILNETANFTFETVAEITCALNRKIEARIIDKKKYLLFSSVYIKQKELDEYCNKVQTKINVTKKRNVTNDNYKNTEPYQNINKNYSLDSLAG